MKRFLELLANRKNEIDEQLLEMLYSFTEFQTFKDIMLTEKKRIELENKKREESVKKKMPQKPLKQSSNNNTNIFSVDKKDFLFKEEQKLDGVSKNNKNDKSKNNKINENVNKKEAPVQNSYFYLFIFLKYILN